MRSLLDGFTTRGRAFIAAGATTGALGLGLGQRTLLSIGVLLIALPLLCALAASRARYRIRCSREITPGRVPAGQAAAVSIRISNISRLPTGLLLAEDTVPYSLGTRPRFVLDRIEPGGSRMVHYPLQSDRRGKFTIGPMHIRVADTFGLIRIGSEAGVQGTLVVTPAITSLPRTALAGTWLGEGGTRASTAAAAGEDDVVPRAYRDGDELRRVHWRSTARYGELMVRREEQHWRNRAVIFLDARANGHAGHGLSSSFEFAVEAAASIGVHLAREGIDGELIIDSGAVRAPGSFEDVLLDTLAVIRPSRSLTLSSGLAQMPKESSGLLIAVVGSLPEDQALRLAAARRTSGPAMALLLAVSTWATDRQGGGSPRETETTAALLAAAGWRVVTVTAGMPLKTAWEALTHPYQARTSSVGNAVALAGSSALPADQVPASGPSADRHSVASPGADSSSAAPR